MQLWLTILIAAVPVGFLLLLGAGWTSSLIEAHRNRVFGRRIARPPTSPDGHAGIDPAELEAFIRNSPLVTKATQSARRAGFSIHRSLDGIETDARRISHFAAAAGVCTLPDLESLLVTDFDGYFGRLMPPADAKREKWGVNRPYVFEMLVVRSLVGRLTIDVLTRLTERSVAKRLVVAAEADAAAQRST
jgi:hypothetical protein